MCVLMDNFKDAPGLFEDVLNKFYTFKVVRGFCNLVRLFSLVLNLTEDDARIFGVVPLGLNPLISM